MGIAKMLGVTVLILVGLLLGSLAITFVLAQNNINIINNLFVEDTVKMTPKLQGELDAVYTEDLELEIPLCVGGVVDEDGIRLMNTFEPEIKRNDERSVTFVSCPVYIGSERTVATLHNHPGGTCKYSQTDLETYGEAIDRGQSIFGIKCDEGYVWYILGRLDTEVVS